MGLKARIPDAKAPGYLRRERMRLEFVSIGEDVKKAGEKITDNPKLLLKWQDAQLNWLLEYIIEPKDRDKARQALLDASEDEISKLTDDIIEGEGGADPKGSDSSEDG